MSDGDDSRALVWSGSSSGKLLARTATGESVLVPLEKRAGGGVAVSTAPGVLLHLPARDVLVYATMRVTIERALVLSEHLSTYQTLVEEAEVEARRARLDVEGLVRAASQHAGVDLLSLPGEVAALGMEVVALGDQMGQLMRVDEATQALMRKARVLAIDLRSQMERMGGRARLKADGELRRLVRALRLFAVDLQGEIERRVGT